MNTERMTPEKNKIQKDRLAIECLLTDALMLLDNPRTDLAIWNINKDKTVSEIRDYIEKQIWRECGQEREDNQTMLEL